MAAGNPAITTLDGYPHIKVVCRTDHKPSKVALISGGGFGHEPSHAGYVGKGMLRPQSVARFLRLRVLTPFWQRFWLSPEKADAFLSSRTIPVTVLISGWRQSAPVDLAKRLKW